MGSGSRRTQSAGTSRCSPVAATNTNLMLCFSDSHMLQSAQTHNRTEQHILLSICPSQKKIINPTIQRSMQAVSSATSPVSATHEKVHSEPGFQCIPAVRARQVDRLWMGLQSNPFFTRFSSWTEELRRRKHSVAYHIQTRKKKKRKAHMRTKRIKTSALLKCS